MKKMKLAKVEKSTKGSLYTTVLLMTLTPLIIYGVIVATYLSYSMRESIENETKNNLKNVAISVLTAYDTAYPGEYLLNIYEDKVELVKGDYTEEDLNKIVDAIKEDSNVDISMLIAKVDTVDNSEKDDNSEKYLSVIRTVTTVANSDGERYTGTLAADVIAEDIVIGGKDHFYNNVNINNTPYFAYYRPVYSIDGKTCLGAIGVAKPQAELTSAVARALTRNILITIVITLITAFFIMQFTSQIVDCIQKILVFLRELAADNLNAKLDETVMSREDELGEIGNASVKLQLSLKKLIERDGLTGLYNRRAGEKNLDDLEKQHVKSSIAIGDIDFFKKFNDNFGHECGDEVLREVAKTLNEGMRGKGFVARWGGEEFLLVFEGFDKMAAGLALGEILQSVRDNRVLYDGQEHSVTMTFGVTDRLDDEKVSDQIRRADDKLYEGKQGGRNRVVV